MPAAMKLNVGVKGLKRGSNINDIVVPEILRQRRKTNISWFDAALGGDGLTPSTCMMLTGGPGCGKTTMLLQLADSLTASGYSVLLNTGEESLYQVKMVTERLKLKNGFVAGQDHMVKDIIDHSESIRKRDPKKQMFLLQDSLQTMDDGKYKNGTTGATPLRCCEMLTNYAKETNAIVIFIGQVNKDGDFAGKNQIRHAVDSHAKLYFDTDKRSETFGERLFEFTKNRFGVSGKTFVLGMSKTGLTEKGSITRSGDTSDE